MKLSHNGFIRLERMLRHLWRSKKSNKFTMGLNPHPNIMTGFTLVELMITCAIVAIIAGIGGFVVNRQLPEYRLKGDTRTIASSLMLARMKAIKTGLNYAIRFNLDHSPQDYVLQRGGSSGGDEPYRRELSTGVNIEKIVNKGVTSTSGIVSIEYKPTGSYDSSSIGQIRLRLGTLNDGYKILLTPTTGRIQTKKGW